MTMKSRFENIQSFLHCIDTDGCYFLSLLSIAEEYTKSKIDLIDAIWLARGNDLITDDYYVNDAPGLLTALTGHVWVMQKVTELPEVINDDEYTVAVWYNPRTQFKHFRRRYFDTLISSVTVKEGSIAYYHIFRAIP